MHVAARVCYTLLPLSGRCLTFLPRSAPRPTLGKESETSHVPPTPLFKNHFLKKDEKENIPARPCFPGSWNRNPRRDLPCPSGTIALPGSPPSDSPAHRGAALVTWPFSTSDPGRSSILRVVPHHPGSSPLCAPSPEPQHGPSPGRKTLTAWGLPHPDDRCCVLI